MQFLKIVLGVCMSPRHLQIEDMSVTIGILHSCTQVLSMFAQVAAVHREINYSQHGECRWDKIVRNGEEEIGEGEGRGGKEGGEEGDGGRGKRQEIWAQTKGRFPC